MKKTRGKIKNDFISTEKRDFIWSLGTILASSLSGFIAGLIVASVFFYTLFDFTWRANTFLNM